MIQPPPLSGRALRAVVSALEGPAGATVFKLIKHEAGITEALELPLEAGEGVLEPGRPIGPEVYLPPADHEGAA